MIPADVMAIREALNDADGAAATPDDLLTLQAQAVVEAIERLGYFRSAGWSYAVVERGTILELGFNTAGQARLWAETNNAPDAVLRRRQVGTWERVETPADLT